MTPPESQSLPLLLITQGDVAGVGPEIIVAGWSQLQAHCRPVVVGDPGWLRRAAHTMRAALDIVPVRQVDEVAATDTLVPCLVATATDLSGVPVGQATAAGGKAAYDFLCAAIDRTLAGEADGIVTAPLHKEGLHAAGIRHPGHTEILAERCGVRDFAMVLYQEGLAVAHVTLHMALREVFQHLSSAAILDKARLLDGLLQRLLGARRGSALPPSIRTPATGDSSATRRPRSSGPPSRRPRPRGSTSAAPGRAIPCLSAPATAASTVWWPCITTRATSP